MNRESKKHNRVGNGNGYLLHRNGRNHFTRICRLDTSVAIRTIHHFTGLYIYQWEKCRHVCG